MVRRKICIFSGTRAEYGLLKPLMKEVRKDKTLQLQIMVSGMHLSPEFGLTYQQIEKDGFEIDEKVEMLLSSDTPVGLSKSTGVGLISFGETYARLKPDIVVVLGDRFEAFAAAAAAMVSKIPIAHLHGGEATEGLIDEAIRHCITKMSHLHFTSTEEYRKRVIQLGEQPSRVFHVGALGIENIKKLRALSKNVLQKELNFVFKKRNLLVTFHPVTLENNTSETHFRTLLDALDCLRNTSFIFTKANADPGGILINKMINEYVSKNSSKAAAFTSLGQKKYLSLMRYMDAVVGNSSSGILEAPSFRIGTINIGDRQKGRIRAESVIDCACRRKSILKSFEKLYSPKFQSLLKTVKNPYQGKDSVAVTIKEIIKKADLDNIIKKTFYDIA